MRHPIPSDEANAAFPCSVTPTGIGSGSLNWFPRPGKDAKAGSGRLFWRPAARDAQGISTIPVSGRYLRSRRVCPHPSHLGQTMAFGYAAVLFLIGALLMARVRSVTSPS